MRRPLPASQSSDRTSRSCRSAGGEGASTISRARGHASRTARVRARAQDDDRPMAHETLPSALASCVRSLTLLHARRAHLWPPCSGPLRTGGELHCAARIDRAARRRATSAIMRAGTGTLRTTKKLRAGTQGRHARRSGRIVMTVSRRNFARLAAAGTAAIASPAIAQQARSKWRMTSSFPKAIEGLWGAVADRRQVRQRDERRQVRDRNLRAGRDRARAAGARRGRQRHGRMRPYLFGLLHRQEPGADLRRLAAVRPDGAPAQCLVHVRRRQEADRRDV